MDHEPNAVHVERTFERPQGPSLVIVAILAGVLLALVKPWSFGQPGSLGARASPLPSRGSGSVLTSPSPGPSPRVDPNGMACLGGDVEQVVAFERFAHDEVRNWIAVDDLPVTGLLDPHLARITIYSSHVVGLGICGQWAGDGVPVAGRIIDVQLVTTTPDGPAYLDLGRPRLITLELGGQDAAVLYGSPQQLVVAPQSPGAASGRLGAVLPALRPWALGSYAIAFAFAADGPTVVRWLGIDLVAGPGESR